MASISESTRLLADSEPQEAGEDRVAQNHSTTTPTQDKPPYYRPTVVFTHLAAASSIIAFVFDLTGLCIDAASPGGFYLPELLRWFVQVLFALSLPSIIFSSLNLARFRRARRPLSLILNLIVDGFLVFEMVPLGSQALSRFYDEDFYWWHNGKARAAAKAELVILGIGLVANLVAGLIHLILFALRFYALITSGSWRAWKIPSGEFKVELSIKFLRQEERTEPRDANA